MVFLIFVSTPWSSVSVPVWHLGHFLSGLIGKKKKAIQFQRDGGCENPPGTPAGLERSTCTGYSRMCVRRDGQDGAAACMQRSTQGEERDGYCNIQTIRDTLGHFLGKIKHLAVSQQTTSLQLKDESGSKYSLQLICESFLTCIRYKRTGAFINQTVLCLGSKTVMHWDSV